MSTTNTLAYFLTPHSREEHAAVAWLGKAGADVLGPLEAMLGRLAAAAFDEGRWEQLQLEALEAQRCARAVKT